MTTRRDFLKTMTMASAGLAFGAGDVLGARASTTQRKVTDKVKIAAYQVEGEKMWGVQFHPEVFHSEDGTQMLKNFVVEVCGCRQDWSAASFIETTVA